MCIFNKPVSQVSGTKILVSCTSDNRQFTVYQNYVTAFFDAKSAGRENKQKLKKALDKIKSSEKTTDTNAMILPFPGSEVELVDLSHYPTLFSDCNNCFPILQKKQQLFYKSKRKREPTDYLEIHSCGSYNVSIARTLPDINRIDPSVFTLSPNVGKVLDKYYSQDFGFLICCFKENGEKHPLGYIHSLLKTASTSESQLFVPTRHEHGHEDDTEADWDHEIYSVNTLGKGESGTDIQELREMLEKEDKPDFEIVVKTEIGELLKKLPVRLVKVDYFRRRLIVGEYENKDIVLSEVSKIKEGTKPDRLPKAKKGKY
eukprot:TRINITY_DN4745_c0_g1_i2.p1 TRINITY_DN4745_c0_g1~~TRINITY_DN4745_c0_g1_i2.p1  ORF type:complete len:316 (+),score=59.13 TRINITY_DN4745_c0_g1_i2:94-1041(+)